MTVLFDKQELGFRGRVADLRRRVFRHHPTIGLGGGLLAVMALVAVFAPYLFTPDPITFNPIDRLITPGAAHWFGTDMYGRDIYSRTVYGTRISLIVGLAAAVLRLGSQTKCNTGMLRSCDGQGLQTARSTRAAPSAARSSRGR